MTDLPDLADQPVETTVDESAEPKSVKIKKIRINAYWKDYLRWGAVAALATVIAQRVPGLYNQDVNNFLPLAVGGGVVLVVYGRDLERAQIPKGDDKDPFASLDLMRLTIGEALHANADHCNAISRDARRVEGLVRQAATESRANLADTKELLGIYWGMPPKPSFDEHPNALVGPPPQRDSSSYPVAPPISAPPGRPEVQTPATYGAADEPPAQERPLVTAAFG